MVVSLETPDGGKSGSDDGSARARLAAKMMVEGQARLATPEEVEGIPARRRRRRKQTAERAAAAAKAAVDGGVRRRNWTG